MGKQWKQCQTLFFWAPKSLQIMTAARKLKDTYSLEGELCSVTGCSAVKQETTGKKTDVKYTMSHVKQRHHSSEMGKLRDRGEGHCLGPRAVNERQS